MSGTSSAGWTNPPKVLFHGTDEAAAAHLMTPSGASPNGVRLSLCSPFTDFGQGFYLTSREDQAENWANLRVAGMRAPSGLAVKAAVVRFTVDREALGDLSSMSFVFEGTAPSSEYWSLVQHCRLGNDHGFAGKGGRFTTAGHASTGFYECVHGLVALPAQRLVIKDCDQYSFHTQAAVGLLNPVSHTLGSPTF